MSETAEVVRAAIAATAALFDDRVRDLQGAVAMHMDVATRLRLELTHAQDARARERKELEAAHARTAESLDALERAVQNALGQRYASDLRVVLIEAMKGRGEDEE